MASTYSTNLAIELIGTGEQSGTWGTTTNTNLGTLLEQAISGYVTQAITDGADTTITIPNGTTGVARNMAIEMTGALTATRNLIVPANKKLYFIFNNTSGGFAVTVKVTGLTGVSVPNGKKVILVSNGTDIVEAVNQVVGNLAVGGTLGVTGVSSFGAGAIGAPSIYLSTDTTTGFYRIGANNVGFAVSGAKLLDMSSSGLTVRVAGNNTLVVDSSNVQANGTLGVTGLITGSANGKFLLANGATTGSLYADIQNTGGRLIIGVANSAGTSPITSSTAYSVILNSDNGTPIELAVSSVTQLKVISTGVTIPGTLGVTGAATFTGALNVDEDVLTVFTAQFPNVGSVQTISITDGYGGYVVITAVQSGVGKSSRTLPFVKHSGSIAIGTSSTAVITGEPISSVGTSGGNITVTPVAANTYISYAIYYTPLVA